LSEQQSLRRITGIDGEHGAGDVAAGLAQQEFDAARHVDRFGHAPQGTAALDLLEASEPAAEWLGADLFAAYLLFKRAEIKGLENLDETEICRRYAEVY